MKRNGINKQAGAIANVVHAADDLGIGVEFTLTAVDAISLVIPDSELTNKKDDLIQTLWQEIVPDQMAAEEGLSIVAAVGSGLAESFDEGVAGIVGGLLHGGLLAGVRARFLEWTEC